jgi:hypothetical protein
MELLDQYLKTVRSYLPKEQKDDIINELSENLRSQMDDKEVELGRPLNESEVESILKQHGHPMIVAGRFRQDQRSFTFGRQIISPILFPFYTKVLSFNLGITAIVLVVVWTALFASGQPATFSSIFSVLLLQVLLQFGFVTVIFAAMERQFAKHPDRWDPRRPNHPYYVNISLDFDFSKESQYVPRLESISQLIALSISIIWLRAVRESSFLVLGPAALFLKFAPIWRQFYLPVVLISFWGVLQAAINLFRPDWVRLRSVTRVVLSGGMLVIWFLLLRAGSWIVPPTASVNSTTDFSHAVQVANQCFFFSLLIAIAISGFQLFRDIRRLVGQTSSKQANLQSSKQHS